MMSTRSANSVAEELFELLVDNGFTNTSTHPNGWETEWTSVRSNGSYTTIEVVVTPKEVEIWRGEFSKDDVQNGAKGNAVTKGGISREAAHLIRRLS